MTASATAAKSGPAALDRTTLLVALTVALGTLMPVLDTTVVNVALGALGRDLGAPLAAVQWTITGYLLTIGLAMPLTGWAVDRFGGKRLLLTAIAVFGAGSVLSGFAWSVTSLIAFRVVQGIGAGITLPAGQAVLGIAAGPQRMGRAMSIASAPMLVGPVLGPVLGGALIQHLNWPWIFFVNLPVAGLALALGARLLPDGRPGPHGPPGPQHGGHLDIAGFLTLSGGIGLLFYGLSAAASGAGLSRPEVYGPAAAGAALLAAFTAISLRRGPAAIIDVRLFTSRTFTAASVTLFLMSVGVFGAMVLLPLYYQAVRGAGAATAGLLLAPQGAGAALVVPFAGKLTDRIGPALVIVPGALAAAAGTVAFALAGPATPDVVLAASLFIRGVGLGATMTPAMAASLTAVDRLAVPQAATAASIVRQLGGAFAAALFAGVLARHLATSVPALSGPLAAGDASALPASSRAAFAVPLSRAFDHTFWLALALTAALVAPAAFLSRRPAAAGPPGPQPPEPPASQPGDGTGDIT